MPGALETDRSAIDSGRGPPAAESASREAAGRSGVADQKPMLSCNICREAEFGFGPGGRLSVTGEKPYCLKCGSLERHRAFRSVFLQLMSDFFRGARVLQISRDASVVPQWFRSYEVSDYAGDNSLDLMRIDRETGSYDIVICNHVIEHVQYDNAAMTELVRILSPTGFLFLTFPDPVRKERTAEFNEPAEAQHDHWRVYGRDVADKFRRYVPHAFVLAHDAADPVTGAPDRVYLLSRSASTAARLMDRLVAVEVINDPLKGLAQRRRGGGGGP